MLRVGFMVVAEDCHNNCVFCDATRLGTGRVLTRRKVMDQLAHYVSSGVHELVISGGEPLHHPDLLDIINAAKASGIERVSVYTTACFDLVPHSASDLEAAGADAVMVSLFGPNRRIHNAVARNPLAFDSTLNGLKALARTKMVLTANSPVTRANYRQLAEMLEILAAHRVTVWQLSDIHPTTAVLENINVHASYEAVAPLIETIVDLGAAKGVEVMMQEYPLCVLGKNYPRSQEICRAWYTELLTEGVFGTETYIRVPPISAPRRTYVHDCDTCSLKPYCRGVPSTYIERYPAALMHPVNEPDIKTIVNQTARAWLIRHRMIS